MALDLIQASYAASSVTAMIGNAQDRAAAIRPVIEKSGGELHGLWFALGEFGVVVIAEVPDNVGSAAIAMTIGASGAMSACRTMPLVTSADAVEAVKKAASIAYQPPRERNGWGRSAGSGRDPASGRKNPRHRPRAAVQSGDS